MKHVDKVLACFRLSPAQKTTDREGVSRELLDRVAEELWDSSAPVMGRAALQGEWLYQARFLPAVAALEAAGVSRFERWLRLTLFTGCHPKLLASRAFRRRLAARRHRPASDAGRRA